MSAERSRSTAEEPAGEAALEEMLAPVHRALEADATAESGAILRRADGEAEAIVVAAREEVDHEVALATERALASGRERARQAREQAEDERDRLVLSARATLGTQVETAAVRAAISLRQDARYPALLDRLEGLVREQLGARATIERDPDPVGGVIGTLDARRVDYTLPTLARRALGALGEEVAAAWD